MDSSRPLPLFVAAGCSSGADDAEPYRASIGSNERADYTDALGVAIVVAERATGGLLGPC